MARKNGKKNRTPQRQEAQTGPLRVSEEGFRRLVELSFDGIVIHEEGKILFVNPAGAELLGAATPEQCIGRPMMDFVHPDYQGIVEERVQRIRKKKEGAPLIEEKFIRLDGSEVDVEVTATSITHAGKPAVQVVFRDITARKRTEKRLRESEERYRSLVETSPDAITITDLSGKLVMANRRSTELHGCESVEELLGLDTFELIVPEDRQRAMENARKTLETGSIRNVEYTMLRKDGVSFSAELSASVIVDAEGRPTAFIGVVRDITARKRAEEKLRESEEKYRTLIEQSLQGLVVIQDFRIVFANTAFTEISGYSVEELLSLSPERVKAMVHPEDQALVWGRFRDRLAGKPAPPRYEYRGIRKDGTVCQMEMFASRAEYRGRPAIQGTIVDITARKRVEEALRESEERYRCVFEQSPIGIGIASVGGKVVAANQAMQAITGYSLEELGNIKLADTYENIENREVLVEAIGQHDRVVDFPARLKRKDGTSYEAILNVSRINLGGEDFIHTICQDITERKQAEEALRESEGRLKEAQALGRIGNWEFDVNHQKINWSDQVYRLYERDPALGPPTAEEEAAYYAPEQAERLREYARRATEEGKEFAYDLQVKLPSGTLAHFSATMRPIKDEGGRIVRLFGTVQDITERKQVEEALRRQERLAAVGQLAGGIAHDFNNLLTTIMLYAQMPLSKPDLPPDLARILETILSESRQASKLVQQILDFSRRSPIETRPVNLKPFIEEAIRVLQRTVPESISLLLKVGPGEFVAKADPTRIQQVLMNLVVNARDAMPEGGKLLIGLSRTELGPNEEPPAAEMTPGQWICLTISDTGTGIPPKVLPHVFEPFFTTKPPEEGAGLGLAQVYGIVTQHGGHVGVETEVGKGTTFRVYLPAYQAGEEEAPQEEAAPIALEGKGETILLVEDNERIREAGREILESLGYRVLTAADGREALKAYQTAAKIDLVLTDVVMPEMGGTELVRELKKASPHLKALAITGHLFAEDQERLRAEGILDVVYKPFDISTLAQVIRNALDAD